MGKVHASLFSGFGAADLAATWMGWDNAFWCEIEDFPRTVLSYWFPKSKGYGNIKETDFTPWRGKIDVLTGGFPCQPFSVAGQRKGSDDDRYLWPEMLRAIREIRPTWIIGENVAGILSMVQPGSEITMEGQAFFFEEADKETILEQEHVTESVCRSLEQEGYSVQPVVIPACAVSAPHRRDRIFFIAYSDGERCDNWSDHRKEQSVCDNQERNTQKDKPEWDKRESRTCKDGPDVANAQRFGRGQILYYLQSKQSEGDGSDCIGCKRYAPYAYSKQLENTLRTWNRISESANLYSKRDWQNFPTQPPVCRGNDGLPFDVVRLTISFTAWRTGSVKGYGNAIVPQVMYEIFKAIKESEK